MAVNRAVKKLKKMKSDRKTRRKDRRLKRNLRKGNIKRMHDLFKPADPPKMLERVKEEILEYGSTESESSRNSVKGVLNRVQGAPSALFRRPGGLRIPEIGKKVGIGSKISKEETQPSGEFSDDDDDSVAFQGQDTDRSRVSDARNVSKRLLQLDQKVETLFGKLMNSRSKHPENGFIAGAGSRPAVQKASIEDLVDKSKVKMFKSSENLKIKSRVKKHQKQSPRVMGALHLRSLSKNSRIGDFGTDRSIKNKKIRKPLFRPKTTKNSEKRANQMLLGITEAAGIEACLQKERIKLSPRYGKFRYFKSMNRIGKNLANTSGERVSLVTSKASGKRISSQKRRKISKNSFKKFGKNSPKMRLKITPNDRLRRNSKGVSPEPEIQAFKANFCSSEKNERLSKNSSKNQRMSINERPSTKLSLKKSISIKSRQSNSRKIQKKKNQKITIFMNNLSRERHQRAEGSISYLENNVNIMDGSFGGVLAQKLAREKKRSNSRFSKVEKTATSFNKKKYIDHILGKNLSNKFRRKKPKIDDFEEKTKILKSRRRSLRKAISQRLGISETQGADKTSSYAEKQPMKSSFFRPSFSALSSEGTNKTSPRASSKLQMINMEGCPSPRSQKFDRMVKIKKNPKMGSGQAQLNRYLSDLGNELRKKTFYPIKKKINFFADREGGAARKPKIKQKRKNKG